MLQGISFISRTNSFYVDKSKIEYHGFLVRLLHSNSVGSSLCTLCASITCPSNTTERTEIEFKKKTKIGNLH